MLSNPTSRHLLLLILITDVYFFLLSTSATLGALYIYIYIYTHIHIYSPTVKTLIQLLSMNGKMLYFVACGVFSPSL